MEVGYGTADCPPEELAPPETLEDGTYPELKGPIVEDGEVICPLARLEDVGWLLELVGPTIEVELEVG